MNICIFSTFDNFFLKELILRLVRKKNNYNYVFYFIGEYNNINNILVKAASLGIFNSIIFCLRSFMQIILKKDLISCLNNNSVQLIPLDRRYILH